MLSNQGSKVALVVPGLCGPSLDSAPEEFLSTPPRALGLLMSRAQIAAFRAEDLETAVLAFFQPAAAAGAPPAVAPLTWLADGGEPTDDFLLRADPVHLRADQACLRLFDSSTFSIEQTEADALVSAFNRHYVGRGWCLHAPSPQRWYLRLPGAPEITTIPPLRIAGQDIDPALPGGPQARDWHALLNEVQMLFHAHPVNTAREQRGEPPINSFWPWGGGRLPQGLGTSLAQVIGAQPLLSGLARVAAIPHPDLPGHGSGLAAICRVGVNLVVLDALEKPSRYGDAESWTQALGRLERDWFTPLRAALQERRITGLEIFPANGKRYAVTRLRLKQFWKRPHPFSVWCHGS